MRRSRFISYLLISSLLAATIVFSAPADSFADSEYTYINDYYHTSELFGVEEHWWSEVSHSKSTLFTNGKVVEECDRCHARRTRTFSWKLDVADSYDHTSYNVIKHSKVFRNSKSITVRLQNPIKGSVVKVKIGKRTYKKKVGNKSKIKIKIKKPKTYGKKVKIMVYYKGRLIGKSYYYDEDNEEYADYSDEEMVVFYAKKIKKGMTKKQVKYTYDWGEPFRTASASGGYSYWYWGSSYVVFKNGKVVYWYYD